jgi:hypothetical protein
MPSAQDCAERLREQAYKTLLPQIRNLEEELQNVSNSLTTGVNQIERKLDALRNIELPTTDLVLGEILGEVIRQKDLETSALALFARGISQRATQEEILTFLLDSAQEFFPRTALFTVRGDRFIGWSSRGYSETIAGNVSSDSFPRSECPQFQNALEGKNPVTTSDLAANNLLQSLQKDSQGPWHLFPLRILQRPVALLFAGGAEGVTCRPEALSILVEFTVLRLENIALKLLYELTAAKPESAPQPILSETATEPIATAAPVVEPAPSMGTHEPQPFIYEQAFELGPVVPEPAPVFEPVIEPEPAPVFESTPIFAPETIPEPMPVIPPVQEPEPPIPAAPPVAAVETFDTWQSDQETIPAPSPQPEKPKAPPKEPFPVPEEAKLHADAKRFARLLVSEIKLYNEHHVAEGRQNQDLYLRLKRDIDRSREMYEKRVSPSVAQKVDYFHDEIIRILGDNDPSTLGSDYPGPRVES